MLSDAQRADFDGHGFCVLQRAFDPDAAARMTSVLWEALDRDLGVRRGDPATWRFIGASKYHKLVSTGVFHGVATPTLRSAIDDLLGSGEWVDTGWGSPLVTFPSPPGTQWSVPRGGWHTDYPVRGTPGALRMFAYLVDVRPRGGGTLVVSGSHRVARGWAQAHPDSPANSSALRKAMVREHPWFADLMAPNDVSDARDSRLMAAGDVLGVPVRVVELACDAGDVVLWDRCLLHTGAPNCLTEPRVMLNHTVTPSREGWWHV